MKSDFRDLKIWQQAKKLRDDLFEFCQSLPPDEKYRLLDQIIRASRSVSANIAEGYGRYHYQENIQFLRQARGSLFELIDHMDVVLSCKYILDTDRKTFVQRIEDLIRGVNGYIKYLKGKKELSS